MSGPAIIICLAVAALSQPATREVPIKSPAEAFANWPNRVREIPAGWLAENPIQLQVFFNLKAKPGSPEAESFLKAYLAFMVTETKGASISVHRLITPDKYTYSIRLNFENWRAYQAHETNPVFLKQYYAAWVPAIDGPIDEQISVLDPRIGTPRD